MSWKLWATCGISLGVALGVGCTMNPPTELTVTTGAGGTTGNTGPAGPGTQAGPTTGTGSGLSAHDMFVTIVYPELTAKPDGATPACAGCHVSGSSGAPIYLAATAEAAYKVITGYNMGAFISNPANSKLINHGEHTGPAMYPQLQTDATAWITQELKERGNTTTTTSTGMPPPITETEALAQFGACMDYQEWLADGLDQLAKMQTGLGECNGCHSQGTGGNWLSLNKQETFTKNTMKPYIRRMVAGTVDMDGEFADLVPMHRWELKGQEAKMCDKTVEDCHPQFDLPQNMIDGINTFVQKTLDDWHAKKCGMNMMDGGTDDGGDGG